MGFIHVDSPQPHGARAGGVVKRHPGIRNLFGNCPYSAILILIVVGFQIALAWTVCDAAWWVILLVAYFVGAIANHMLGVLIHEVSHNLIFKKRAYNQLIGLVANFPICIPVSTSFSLFHLSHHRSQGNYDLDPDIARNWEAKYLGHSFLGKLLWECFFPLINIPRMIQWARHARVSVFEPWILTNFILQIIFVGFVWIFFGPKALIFLLLSAVFSMGPHPLGARIIQEHYVVKDNQETYSYYGPFNRLTLNVGYHNEHHDFPNVPWNRLPRVKRLAPEVYDFLYSHHSLVKLWVRFLTDPKFTLFSRVVRSRRVN